MGSMICYLIACVDLKMIELMSAVGFVGAERSIVWYINGSMQINYGT